MITLIWLRKEKNPLGLMVVPYEVGKIETISMICKTLKIMPGTWQVLRSHQNVLSDDDV